MVSQRLPKIATALDNVGIPYMLIGGQAVAYYGRARFTEDIDLTLGISTDRLDAVLRLLPDLGLKPLVEASKLVDWVLSTMVLPVVDVASGMRVDLIFTFYEFERQAIARAESIVIGGYPIKVAAVEDLIVLKLIAGRPVDIADVEAMVVRSADAVDHAYVRKWLQTYGEMLGQNLVERLDAVIPQPRD